MHTSPIKAALDKVCKLRYTRGMDTVIEYQIQEYGGRRFTNEKTMANALAKDKNWFGTYVEQGTIEEATAKLQERVDYYAKYGRIFRLRVRSINPWRVYGG